MAIKHTNMKGTEPSYQTANEAQSERNIHNCKRPRGHSELHDVEAERGAEAQGDRHRDDAGHGTVPVPAVRQAGHITRTLPWLCYWTARTEKR